jgi:hypothetical protein
MLKCTSAILHRYRAVMVGAMSPINILKYEKYIHVHLLKYIDHNPAEFYSNHSRF